MTAIAINQPAYGPQGQPFAIQVRSEQSTEERWFWTEAETCEARDAAYVSGAIGVTVSGLPFRGCVAGI